MARACRGTTCDRGVLSMGRAGTTTHAYPGSAQIGLMTTNRSRLVVHPCAGAMGLPGTSKRQRDAARAALERTSNDDGGCSACRFDCAHGRVVAAILRDGAAPSSHSEVLANALSPRGGVTPSAAAAHRNVDTLAAIASGRRCAQADAPCVRQLDKGSCRGRCGRTNDRRAAGCSRDAVGLSQRVGRWKAHRRSRRSLANEIVAAWRRADARLVRSEAFARQISAKEMCTTLVNPAQPFAALAASYVRRRVSRFVGLPSEDAGAFADGLPSTIRVGTRPRG